MLTGAFSKKSDGKITTDSRMPSFSKDSNEKFELERDTDEARNGKANDDEKFENILNETLERSKNSSNFNYLFVVDGSNNRNDDDESDEDESDEDESDDDENIDNDNKINNNGCPDNPDDGNPDDDKDSPPNNNKDEDKKRSYKKYAAIAGLAALGAVAVPLAVPVALGAAGFSTAGVVGGSVAAAWQASIGNVAAGSAFALFQSAGAAGLGTTGIAASAAAGGGVFAGIGAGVSKLFNRGNNKNDKPSNIGESSDVTSMVVDTLIVKAESRGETNMNSSDKNKKDN